MIDLDSIRESLTGGARVTSGFRSQAEQDELHRTGKTKAARSAHTSGTRENPGAVDIGGIGPGDLDRVAAELRAAGHPVVAMQYESGHGHNNGTGPHGHFQLAAPGASPSVSASSTVAARTSAKRLQSGTTELSQDSTAAAPVVNPFEMEGAVGASYRNATGKAVEQMGVVDQAIAETQQRQEDAKVILEQRNMGVEAVNEGLKTETAALVAKTTPLMKRRQELADRRLFLSQRSPIEVAIRGLFDRNWNPERLGEVENAVNESLAVAGDNFKQVLSAQDNILKVINTDFDNDSAMINLLQGVTDKKLQFAGLALTAADQVFTKTLQGLEANNGVLAAQNVSRNTILEDMTPGQMETALNNARKTGGQTMIQGVPVSEAQLMERVEKRQQQDLAWQNAQISHEDMLVNRDEARKARSQRADREYLGTLTTQQLQALAANGGQLNGRQFDLPMVGELLQAGQGRDQLIANGTLVQGSRDQFGQGLRYLAGQQRIGGARATQMLGQVPPALAQLYQRNAARTQEITNKIIAAGPNGDLIAQNFAPELQAMDKAQREALDQVANQWAGGNKALLPMAKSFLSGTPLNGLTAAQGLVAMVRGGARFNGKVSPETQAAIDAARRIVKEADTPQLQAGQSMDAFLAAKPNAKQKEQELIQRVADEIGTAYNQGIVSTVIRNAPALAKAIPGGHWGSKLDGQQLQESIATGDAQGLAIAAQKLGIPEATAKALFVDGRNPEGVWDKIAAKKIPGFETLDQARGTVGGIQMQQTYKYMDRTMDPINGRPASAVFANLLANPSFVANAGNYASSRTQSGFGDFVVGSLGSNTVASQMESFGSNAVQLWRGMKAADNAARINKSNAYSTDANIRMKAILAPNVGAKDATTLIQALQQATPLSASQMFNAGTLSSAAPAAGSDAWRSTELRGPGRFDQIESTLLSHKFDDPNLERIRRQAIKDYQRNKDSTDRTMAAYHGDE